MLVEVTLALALLGSGGGTPSEAAEPEADAQFDTVPDDGNVRIQNNTNVQISCTTGGGGLLIRAREELTLRGSPVRLTCANTNVANGVTLYSGVRYIFLPDAGGRPQLGQGPR